ncbi:hypothetical protein DY000_02003388 [Brassica cretica]|uniref:Uncharacterized protein n=1 Tax=Brassica cretica TaxID=69181 RepID=A0ABQ7BTF5_BRACR|nr:hypothetical protein DY000_02003388 [Brassica cretica]
MKTFVVQDAIEDSAESHGRHTIRCMIVQEEFIGYIAEHPNDEEEVEGIDLHQQRYPWEGSDMDYLYDEFIHGSQEVKEEEAKHPNDEEEVEGIDLHQQHYPWEGSDMDYLYDELLSMELTLEIDVAIFHVPNANASSNVDSQL